MPLVKWIQRKRRNNSLAAPSSSDNDGKVSSERRRGSHDAGRNGGGGGSEKAEAATEATAGGSGSGRQRSRSFDPAAVDPSVGTEAAAAALKIMVGHLSFSLAAAALSILHSLPLRGFCVAIHHHQSKLRIDTTHVMLLSVRSTIRW